MTLNEEFKEYYLGDVFQIRTGSHHRIKNKATKPMILIEMRYENYFCEDENVRIKHNYKSA